MRSDVVTVPARNRESRARTAAASALILLLSVVPGLGQAGADGPFAALAGAWSGEGTITMSSGTRERIRCQAAYRLESRTRVDLRLTCASDSYRFELQSDTIAADRALSGTWTELTRRVSGQVEGRVAGDRINLRAESQTFSALLDMTTRGNRQAVSIRSPGSQMSEVSITLARRGR
jgi:hypothetical protein